MKGIIGLGVVAVVALVVSIVTATRAGTVRDNLFSDPAELQAAADMAASSNFWLLMCGLAVIALLSVWAVRDRS